MKLYEAKNIITDVFENPFDKDKFSYFIRNLLKNLHPAEFRRSGYNIPKAFEDFIASYERLGKYEDEEGNLIDVLIIKLKRDHSIDYARSTQRNFVRWYLNDKGKDAALVAFHTEKSSEWRFSFIKMQYILATKKDELTPAKRSSFMVGESGKSHTAQRQLIDLLKNDHAPYLSDIEDAFSIEAVSDEFYEKYKSLLFNMVDEIEMIVKKDKNVKDEFENKNINILNFSKKLLGQIVFLYFLQKKGWLGLDEKEKYGEGDKNFLRSLFNKTKPAENFFNDYLEFLFYDALSKKRITDYYDRFKTRIPFLNGGLFDPIEFYDWQKTDIVIPNEIFSNRKSDEEGSGILDVFDLYNFTVKEDEPLETEVAIDPEMLGKVFERMLEVTERKSKGAFYTPREIVHYMAQQSLLYFLETELNQTVSYNKLGDKQSEIFGNEGRKGQLGILTENKACAVPQADLEKFIHYGEHIIDKDIAIEEGKLKQTANKQTIPESIRQYADTIDQALENIKICDPAVGSGAFPVGIMNEIVKLRKLLTPFLKSENAEERSSYHFKSNAIQNSIYGVDIDAGAVEIAKLRLWLSMVVDEERIDSIEPLPNLEYKIVKGNSLINIPDGTAINDALATVIENLTTAYFHITDKEKKQEQKEIIDSKIQEQLQFVSAMTEYDIDFDFRLYFHEVWKEKDGFDVVIGNPPYVRVDDIDKKNKVVYKKSFNTATGKYDLYYLFFEKAIQINSSNGITSYISPNKYCASTSGTSLRSLLFSCKRRIEILSTSKLKVFADAANYPVITLIKINSDKNSINVREALSIEKLLESTDSNYALNIDLLRKLPNYIIPINVSQKSIETSIKLLNTNKPLGSFIRFSEGVRIPKKFEIEDNGKELHPIIKQYQFEKWSPIKKGSYISDNDLKEIIGKTSLRYKKMFNQKIMIAEDALEISATLDVQNHIPQGGVYFGAPELENAQVINSFLALINSRLMSWVYEVLFGGMHMGGGYLRYRSTFLERLPVNINAATLPQLKNLAIFVLYLKSRSNDKISFFFEQLIDGIVYELYFENEIKQAGCDILKHLNDLPELREELSDDEKLKIITKVFNKFYDKESPVRKNLETMLQVEEVRIIKESLGK